MSEKRAEKSSACVYSISCERGRSYIGETGRHSAVRSREHRYSIKEDIVEKSKLAQYAYEEGHRVGWGKARILEIENNCRYRK
jgi:predicted GIY-YIG superfamily endonuclease